MLKAGKPKNARSKRALEKRDPKVIENVKTALFMRGHNTSAIINEALNDLCSLKKPDAIKFSKKNEILPFEDTTSLEFLSRKNDTSLILLGSHTKKRPNNLTFIRMFDYMVYDMYELGIINGKFLKDIQTTKCGLGRKPCFLFNGEEFEQVETYIGLKNMIIDFFHGKLVERIDLAGLEHVITISLGPSTELYPNGTLHWRVYTIKLKKSGTKLPRVELEEMGPSLDMILRRTRMPTPEQVKVAHKVPKVLKPKKVKNQLVDELGDMYGKVHMEKQDFGKLQTRKMKGLKKMKIDHPNEKNEDQEVDEEELDNADE